MDEEKAGLINNEETMWIEDDYVGEVREKSGFTYCYQSIRR